MGLVPDNYWMSPTAGGREKFPPFRELTVVYQLKMPQMNSLFVICGRECLGGGNVDIMHCTAHCTVHYALHCTLFSSSMLFVMNVE